MNTSRQRFNKVLSAIYFVFTSFVFFCFVMSAIMKTDKDWLSIALCVVLAIVGLFVWHFIHTVMHEVGHAIGVKIAHGKIINFGVFFISFEKRGKKFKRSFVNATESSGYVGYVSSSENTCEKTLKLSLWCSLIASLICLIIVYAVIKFVDNRIIYCLFGCGGMSVLFSIAVNFFSFSDDSDGKILFMPKAELQSEILPRLKTEARLYNGERLIQMEDELFLFASNGYYRYLRFLEEGNRKEAVELLNSLVESADGFMNAPFYIAVEVIFQSILDGNKEFVTENSKLLERCAEDIFSPTLMRILSAFYLYRGDVEWSRSILNTLNTYQDCPCIGLVEVEKRIADNFLKSVAKVG